MNRLTVPAVVATTLVLLASLVSGPPAVAGARAFPGDDPEESPRINTPNDPQFDRCEPDDEDGSRSCSSPFVEQYATFGFAAAATQDTARYRDLGQLSPRRRAQNVRAGRVADAQVSGMGLDVAWKYSAGDPSVDLAPTDSGIDWANESIRRAVSLHLGELPRPQRAAATSLEPDVECTSYDVSRYDANGDGAVNVTDFACDSRVSISWPGRDGPSGLITAQDLIHAFSDGRDDDRNGYVDDIAGWDFFDNDNDAYDSIGFGHGTGEMAQIAAEGNDGEGRIGACPRCRIVPLRTWDTFVQPVDQMAMAALYAADNDIEVLGCTGCGGLFNTRFAREAFAYAYRRGVTLVTNSSDLNSANHNWPTTYDEFLAVNGVVPDTFGLPDAAQALGAQLGPLGLSGHPPVRTYFRNANLSQYGGRAHVVLTGATGSENAGWATGVAGLLVSYGRAVAARLPAGQSLRPGEITQLLRLTAEDVLPANTEGLGTPDPAQPGWDQHFGYGRVDLPEAMARIRAGRIPPQVLIKSPEWFEPLEVGRTPKAAIRARISARGTGVTNGRFRWSLEVAPGIQPTEAEFLEVASGSSRKAISERATLASIDLREVRRRLDARGGGGMPDPAAPAMPAGSADPNEPAFTVRLQVTDERGERGEDRKVLFAFRDASLKSGYPRALEGGGDQSLRLADLDGRPGEELVRAGNSGELWIYGRDGRPLRSFNHGRPVRSAINGNVHSGAPGYRRIEPPRYRFSTPVIGDIDGDQSPDIVAAAGPDVHAWHADGTPVRGWPRSVDPALSEDVDGPKINDPKPNIFSSAVLADLDRDGSLEVVVAAEDGYVYAWRGSGAAVPGFPARLSTSAAKPATIVTTPAIGDIAGDDRPEIVVATNEFGGADRDPSFLLDPNRLVTNVAGTAVGGAGFIHAIDARGKPVPGWPRRQNVLAPILPAIGPGLDQVLADVDGDAKLEVIGGLTAGDTVIRDGDGTVIRGLDSSLAGATELTDRTQALNLFEYPAVADFDGKPGVEVLKGAVSLNTLVNLLISGQNLPFHHLFGAWDATNGRFLPGFPKAHDDWQVLSAPAVADVGGGREQEALAPSGLYLLHAYQPDGREAPGWPKFTGGWLLATPAVGDIDGDGKLDVAIQTREGRLFVWGGDRPACAADEWPTFRANNRGTGAYGQEPEGGNTDAC